MELQTKIEERISVLGYKKKFIAEKFGIGITVFSMFLKGKRKLKEDQLNDVKSYLGLN